MKGEILQDRSDQRRWPNVISLSDSTGADETADTLRLPDEIETSPPSPSAGGLPIDRGIRSRNIRSAAMSLHYRKCKTRVVVRIIDLVKAYAAVALLLSGDRVIG